jgi:short-subunit dehydrogenase
MELSMKQGYALITGATGGLGKAFAFTLAKKGVPLFLTGRSNEKLLALQAELSQTYPTVQTVICPADLADEQARLALEDRLKAENIQICLDNAELGPLHQRPNIAGVKACQQVMPNTPMVLVFDTSFHQTMPEKAYIFGLPYEAYKEHRIR